MKVISVSEFLLDKSPLLDVRSPAEFESGHIPGAISFPLFSDTERAEVGTLYKQAGKEDAIKRGLEIIGPKMRAMIEQAESLESKSFRVHCWRGGMRSQSVAWLLETYGFDVQLLENGYKAYRHAINEFFGSELNLIVLGGYTGTKKTDILHVLKETGEQVIDLEGLAGHQGSSFGNIMSKTQPSTEHFHNLLYTSAKGFDKERPIWIEDESLMIGRCALPQSLYELKQRSPHIIIDLPIDERLDYLVSDYGKAEAALLIKATEGIRKRLGHEQADATIAFIQEGNMKEAARNVLGYYDKNYQYGRDKKKAEDLTMISFEGKTIHEMATTLKNTLYEHQA